MKLLRLRYYCDLIEVAPTHGVQCFRAGDKHFVLQVFDPFARKDYAWHTVTELPLASVPLFHRLGLV